MTIKASGQQTGAAAQDLNPLCTKSKAGAWNKIQAPTKWTISKYLKSFKQLWGGRKFSQPVTRQSETDAKTRSPLNRKGTESSATPGGHGWCWRGTLSRLPLLNHVWGKSSFKIFDKTCPPRRLPRNQHSCKSCFAGSGNHRTRPSGQQRQLCFLRRLASKPNLPAAPPGKSEDADVQTEGRVRI